MYKIPLIKVRTLENPNGGEEVGGSKDAENCDGGIDVDGSMDVDGSKVDDSNVDDSNDLKIELPMTNKVPCKLLVYNSVMRIKTVLYRI